MGRRQDHTARLRVMSFGGHVVMTTARPEEAAIEVRKLARLREAVYRLLGAMLIYPEQAVIAGATDAAHRLRRRYRWAVRLGFYGVWDRFLRCAESLKTTDVTALEEEYLALFSGSTAHEPVSLYESAYLDPASMGVGQVMADLEREYASAGLCVPSSGGGTADHAAVEMEFTSFLCGKEAEAWEAKDMPAVTSVIKRESRFLEEHPCRWFSSLANAVTLRGGSSLYALTTQLARAMTAHDVDFLGTLAERLSAEVRPR